jgi:chorismate mutase/prephenate dehydratase
MQLASSRRRIDRLDREIVRLLNERARESVLVGSLKRNLRLPVRCRERETAVFGNVEQTNAGPLADEELTRIFRQIIRCMRDLQKQLRAEL